MEDQTGAVLRHYVSREANLGARSLYEKADDCRTRGVFDSLV
jgi:hypothetical protein